MSLETGASKDYNLVNNIDQQYLRDAVGTSNNNHVPPTPCIKMQVSDFDAGSSSNAEKNDEVSMTSNLKVIHKSSAP